MAARTGGGAEPARTSIAPGRTVDDGAMSARRWKRPLWVLVVLLLVAAVAPASGWSEEDEAQRIAQIIADEKRYYENEMKPATQQLYRRQFGSEGIEAKYKQAAYDTKIYYEDTHRAAVAEGNWCYHCVTPLGILSADMQKAVKDFLAMRRTEYPREVLNRECLDGRNVSLISKSQCLHKYCSTIVLADHEEGSAFVLRGCAENFGAINVKQLEGREENTCTRLHAKLDIRECICKNRHFCYAGSHRRSAGHYFAAATLLPILIFYVFLY